MPDANGLYVTSAQGQGAVQGSATDYVVQPQSDPFSRVFKFSRFDAVTAVPRELSGLTK